ncbi:MULTISPECIES: Sec-independent protein translocase TatB [Plantibacter]|uniref:Sec-independent protein translocase TatB n=1 Tax=Plantibacter TaxID=190323 RepID=UPI0017804C22|nr:Sec-independent protein translocase TatB [Plantibacter cousiniae]MBD8516057.1 Sec-independent protein translocase TatB [Plantibacter sp. CFBP 8804]CAH0131017.1 Sec-independent protein translocase protein TatB [Plantibacter cousiniae]
MFGLTFDKLLIIGVIAVFLLGPERLPYYASQLARLVRTLRDLASGAKDRMREEMGPEFDEVDWKKLDPRQYDPRRIIREALLDDEPPVTPTVATTAPLDAAPAAVPSLEKPKSIQAATDERLRRLAAGETAAPPFDLEAT